MRFYETTRMINATPERIWSVLTDAGRLADGNFGILSLKGQIRAGARIALVSEVDPKRAFRIKVDRLDAPRHMVWSSGMPLGLFTGRRVFRLDPRGETTEFTMREDYTGLMAPLIFPKIPDLTASFDTFADGLKSAAEGSR